MFISDQVLWLTKQQNECVVVSRRFESYPFYANATEQYIIKWPFDAPYHERLDIPYCQNTCGSHVPYLARNRVVVRLATSSQASGDFPLL